MKKTRYQKYMTECENHILNHFPILKGKFEALLIWTDLNYLYLTGVSSYDAAQKITSCLSSDGTISKLHKNN